ncbi:efflux transporter outer membrane subunit [Pseudomonas sp. NPDC098747]|uniref:efflux transporter outer membrane subunit n=1 Tax=Pseudomonas sp. NPDC098747 TaxID=3364487 RepID=UPI00383A7CB9
MRLGRLMVLSVISLTGCVRVGPDFSTPHEPWIDQWKSPTVDQVSILQPQAAPLRWWEIFGDSTLNGLMTIADQNNADLKLAGLRVLQAHTQLAIAQRTQYPQFQQIGADSLYVHRQQSGGRNPQDSSSWQHGLEFGIGWEADFWGRFSRAVESADAAYFANQANYQHALVLLHAQVAETYFAVRTAEARLRVAKENAAHQKRSFEITEKSFNSGQNSELDLQQAKTQYLGTLSSLPQFEDQVHRLRNALALLIGHSPDQLPELAVNEALIPLVDHALIQDVPAQLLLRRPDIRAAELDVAAQSALVGVAKADFYPSLALLGNIVWSSDSLGSTSNSLDFIAGPSLRWRLDRDQIRNNVRIQDVRLQQLIEVYRDKVRQSAREADDAAVGLSKSLEREKILREASSAAKRSLVLATSQYREGYSDFQRVLDAQQALSIQQDNYLISRSNAVSNLIALHKALGGGWHSNSPLIDQSIRDQMRSRSDWGPLLDDPTFAAPLTPQRVTTHE